jgi:endonuclease YncB( thermonuclease family)
MAHGLLEVEGCVDWSQLWPTGSADADTLVIRVEPGAFRFRPHRAAPFRRTSVFERSVVIGAQGPRRPVGSGGRLVVRLEGIDAPELHYRPSPRVPADEQTSEQRTLFRRWARAFRQARAEAAVRGLRRLVAGSRVARCLVQTVVDEPGEVFDCYGRFVGDLLVHLGCAVVHVNHALVEAGWALPALYTSLYGSEIEAIRNASARARSSSRGVWRSLDRHLLPLTWARRYRRSEGPDHGRLILLTLFRRQASWAVNRKCSPRQHGPRRALTNSRGIHTSALGYSSGTGLRPRAIDRR